RLELRILPASRMVFADAVEIAGLTEHALSPFLFAEERSSHPIDHRQVALQVRDEPRGVGKAGQFREGGSPLEVDEDEAQRLRVMADGEPGDDCPEQLALAGAGGTDDKAMGPHTAVRRFLQVKDEWLPVRPAAARCLEALARVGALA